MSLKEKGNNPLSYQRRARAAYDRLSSSAKRRITEAGLGILRGGLLSRELSNLTESEEKSSRGKIVSHVKIDPEKVANIEELIGAGLAYRPKAGRGAPHRAELTRLGEEVAVVGARLTYGRHVQSEAKKYSALDNVYAYLSGALYHIDYSMKEDRSSRFATEEKRKLSALKEGARELQSEVARFRDSFGSDQNQHNRGVDSTRQERRGHRVIRRGRS